MWVVISSLKMHTWLMLRNSLGRQFCLTSNLRGVSGIQSLLKVLMLDRDLVGGLPE